MSKKIVIGTIAALIVVGAAAANGSDKPTTPTAAPVTSTAPAPVVPTAPTPTVPAPVQPTTPPAPVVPAPAPEPVQPSETVSQENARESAEHYLKYQSFSREGLIGQLEFEDYSTADATYAVDSLNADWNEQAAKSAAHYLEYQSFSHQGLIDQLEFEGYTNAQAVYGVGTTGL